MLRSAFIVAAATAVSALAPSAIKAQGDDERASQSWHAARAHAAAGRPDSALIMYEIARTRSEAIGDKLLMSAALRGMAQVHDVYIGCGDSALVLMRRAAELAQPGDRQSVDDLVRMLAAHGKSAEAQEVLNQGYASVEGLGRAITRESMNWFQANAAIQAAAGREAAALASLTSALNIATRLSSGDMADSAASGEITAVNYWVVYDMAQLRLNAKARSVNNAATGKRLMDALVNAGIGLGEKDETLVPVARLHETLTVMAHECAKNGGKCTPPTKAKCDTNAKQSVKENTP